MSENKFAFDNRVAQRYNQQRAHTAQVSQQIGATIAQVIGRGARLLEIGVGTGRIAHPAAMAGCRVVGFDLSPQMLAEVAPVNGDGTLDVLRADMHALPFSARSMDAVLAVHVLHLSPDIERALAEAARVLKPDGAFLRGRDWIDPASMIVQLRNEFRMEIIRQQPDLEPPSAQKSVADRLADLGAGRSQSFVAAEWTEHMSPAARLAQIEARMDSESWVLSDALFEHVVAHLRRFAQATWPDLDTPQPILHRFVLDVARGDWHHTP